jgi:phytoene dehydrogenase-like protein
MFIAVPVFGTVASGLVGWGLVRCLCVRTPRPFDIEEADDTWQTCSGKPERLTVKKCATLDAPDVTVIGSGVGGLVVAAALARGWGLRVRVLEQHKTEAGGALHCWDDQPTKSDLPGARYTESRTYETGFHYMGAWKDMAPLMRLVAPGITWEQGVSDTVDMVGVSGKPSNWDNDDDDDCNDDFDCVVTATKSTEAGEDDGDDDDDAWITKIVHRFKGGAKQGRRKWLGGLLRRFPQERGQLLALAREMKTASSFSRLHFILKLCPRWLENAITGSMRCVEHCSSLRLLPWYRSHSFNQILHDLQFSTECAAVLKSRYGNHGCESPPLIVHTPMVEHFFHGTYYPAGGTRAWVRNMIQCVQSKGGQVFINAPVSNLVSASGSLREKAGLIGLQYSKNSNDLNNVVYIPAGERVVSNAGLANTIRFFSKPSHTTSGVPPSTVVSRRRCVPPRHVKPGCSHVSVFVALDGTATTLDLPPTNIWHVGSSLFQSSRDTWSWSRSDQNVETSGPPTPVFLSFPTAKVTSRANEPATAILITPFNPNNLVSDDDDEYAAQKDRVAHALMDLMHRYVPSTIGRVVRYHAGTPKTNAHYFRSDGGSSYGASLALGKRWVSSLYRPEGLQRLCPNLYLSGQDVGSNGVAGATMGAFLCVSQMQHYTALPALFGKGQLLEEMKEDIAFQDSLRQKSR